MATVEYISQNDGPIGTDLSGMIQMINMTNKMNATKKEEEKEEEAQEKLLSTLGVEEKEVVVQSQSRAKSTTKEAQIIDLDTKEGEYQVMLEFMDKVLDEVRETKKMIEKMNKHIMVIGKKVKK